MSLDSYPDEAGASDSEDAAALSFFFTCGQVRTLWPTCLQILHLRWLIVGGNGWNWELENAIKAWPLGDVRSSSNLNLWPLSSLEAYVPIHPPGARFATTGPLFCLQ